MKKLQGINTYLGEVDIKGDVAKKMPDGRWATARSIGWCGIIYRVKAAWKVLRGYADIVVWELP